MEENLNATGKLALSPVEAAAALGVGRSKIYQLIHMSSFPTIRLDGRVLIPVDRLQQWLDDQVDIEMD